MAPVKCVKDEIFSFRKKKIWRKIRLTRLKKTLLLRKSLSENRKSEEYITISTPVKCVKVQIFSINQKLKIRRKNSVGTPLKCVNVENFSARILKILPKNSMSTPVNEFIAHESLCQKIENLRENKTISTAKICLIVSKMSIRYFGILLGKSIGLGRERRSHEGCILCKPFCHS